MQALPRSAAGMAASASAGMAAVMHQQLCAGRPAAMAHWLGCPHKGQVAVKDTAGSGVVMQGPVYVGCAQEKSTPKSAFSMAKSASSACPASAGSYQNRGITPRP